MTSCRMDSLFIYKARAVESASWCHGTVFIVNADLCLSKGYHFLRQTAILIHYFPQRIWVHCKQVSIGKFHIILNQINIMPACHNEHQEEQIFEHMPDFIVSLLNYKGLVASCLKWYIISFKYYIIPAMIGFKFAEVNVSCFALGNILADLINAWYSLQMEYEPDNNGKEVGILNFLHSPLVPASFKKCFKKRNGFSLK